MLGVGVIAALAASIALALALSPAQATTGNADGLPEPKILVNPSIGDFYIGRFYLTKVERSSGVQSAVLDIDYTESVEHEFIVGDGQFYQYDAQGKLTSWTASLYPFVYKNGLMYCNLLVPGSVSQVIGKLVFEKPHPLDTASHPNQETVDAKLTIGAQTYNATFKQAEDDTPAPAVLPKAQQTGSASATTGQVPVAESGTSVGGVYSSVVHYAETLSSS